MNRKGFDWGILLLPLSVLSVLVLAIWLPIQLILLWPMSLILQASFPKLKRSAKSKSNDNQSKT